MRFPIIQCWEKYGTIGRMKTAHLLTNIIWYPPVIKHGWRENPYNPSFIVDFPAINFHLLPGFPLPRSITGGHPYSDISDYVTFVPGKTQGAPSRAVMGCTNPMKHIFSGILPSPEQFIWGSGFNIQTCLLGSVDPSWNEDKGQQPTWNFSYIPKINRSNTQGI